LAKQKNYVIRDILIIAGVLSLVGVVYSSVYLAGADKTTRGMSEMPITTIDTDDPSEIIQVGNQLMDAGRFPEAISHYSRALALDSSLVDVTVDRGSCYFGLEMYDEALADFFRALSLQPYHAIAYFNIGIVNGRRGNDSLMAVYWEKYLGLAPDGELSDQVRQYLDQHKNAEVEQDAGM